MTSSQDTAADVMATEGVTPNPVVLAIAAKSLALDLPITLALEAMRWNVRVGEIWLSHLARVAALGRPALLEQKPLPRTAPPAAGVKLVA